MMSYSYDYLENGMWLLMRTMFGMPTLMGIAAYVLTALALYTVAKRRGLKNPWLAWIPVADSYLLGSLSDQYRYVVNGENKFKRKILLVLRILIAVMSTALFAVLIAMCIQAFGGVMRGIGEDELMDQLLGLALSLLGLSLPLIGIAIAYTVFRYMALYDVYKSMDPSNCILFLVLSILFGITRPFFLFFSRNRDDGMPPRRQDPVSIPQQSSNEWVDEEKDYL